MKIKNELLITPLNLCVVSEMSFPEYEENEYVILDEKGNIQELTKNFYQILFTEGVFSSKGGNIDF